MKILPLLLSTTLLSCTLPDYYWSYNKTLQRHIKPQKSYYESIIKDKIDVDSIYNMRRLHRVIHFNNKEYDASFVVFHDGFSLVVSKDT